MFQTIKATMDKAIELVRVRNVDQLCGPTILRTTGAGPAPRRVCIGSQARRVKRGDLKTRRSPHVGA